MWKKRFLFLFFELECNCIILEITILLNTAFNKIKRIVISNYLYIFFCFWSFNIITISLSIDSIFSISNRFNISEYSKLPFNLFLFFNHWYQAKNSDSHVTQSWYSSFKPRFVFPCGTRACKKFYNLISCIFVFQL